MDQGTPQRQCFIVGAQVENIAQVPGDLRQATRPAPGRQQQSAVRQLIAVSQLQAMALRVEALYRVIGQMLDTQLSESRVRTQAATGQVHGASQHALGQRWALIRHVWLGADQYQPAGVTLIAQGQRCTATCMTRANDNQWSIHGMHS
ncbi:Signal transduction histidine kinase [Pseudomonas syringae pv. actinidiae]|uniref:Signal transduction histidine kinase n=1 Tax=Pseudomonas syringae pv. actinidiae TaxID=103796 RepID=A0A2V0QLH8_PSESF|nr:Signal transduction histidine kinase [Pseudomonas syringae pv. actinidiae]